MNLSENDDEIDLGLTLGSRSYCMQTNLNNSSGAGVNANSRIDMGFAASDPLSELVWSPHNGLSLKCADSTLAINKPFLLWNVGQSTHCLSTSLSVREKLNGDGNIVDTGNLVSSQPFFNVDGKFGDKADLGRSSRSNPILELGASHGRRDVNICKVEEDAGTTDVHAEQNNKDRGEDGFCGSQKVQIADIAESSKRKTGQDALADEVNKQFSRTLVRRKFNERGRAEFNASSSNLMGLAVAVQSEPEAKKVSETLRCSPFKETSVTEETNKKITKLHFLAPPLNKLEFYGENNFDEMTAKETLSLGETRLPRENSGPLEISPTYSGTCLYRDKGKSKALSNGDIYGRPSNDVADDSHESVESCNSGMKRPNCDQDDLIVKSKRIKQSFDSTSIFGPDSSFMNWISNMVKGLSDSTKYESSSPLPLALPCPSDVPGKSHQENFLQSGSEKVNKGFQTMFQSMYCRNTKTSDSEGKKEASLVEESKELIVADKTTFEDLPRSFDKKIDDSFKLIDVSNDFASTSYARKSDFAENKASKMLVCTADNTDLITPSSISNIPERCDPPTSLWITRLYTKTPKSENFHNPTQGAGDFSIECSKENVGGCMNDDALAVEIKDVSALEKEKSESAANDESFVDLNSSLSKLSPILPSQKLRNSEAMASVFARRLDALKNSVPLERKNSLSCFFCGKTGHVLRGCPNVMESEAEDLLLKVGSLEMVKESACMCIRCFQLDHWAISCPLVSSSKRPRLGSSPGYLLGNVKESSSKTSACNEPLKRITSNSENYLKDGQKFPLCSFADEQSRVAPTEMFQAVRKLRLSRADVLRWMNSGVPLSHLNGFFLRLRLGKLEAELGGTGYYAACITGDVREHLGRKSNKCILVNVGGFKSSVGSQYISNHDFLEDEIDVWWRRMVKAGSKIPSLDELNSKLQDRTTLGF